MEVKQTASISSSPRKRKRSYIPTQDPDDQGSRRRRALPDEAQPDYSGSNEAPKTTSGERWAISHEASDEERSRSDQETHDKQTSVKGRGKRNKRWVQNSNGGGAGAQSPSNLDPNGLAPAKSVEAADSNQDDVEVEEAGEYTSVDNGVKDEESSKYMPTLGSIHHADQSRPEEAFGNGILELNREMFRQPTE